MLILFKFFPFEFTLKPKKTHKRAFSPFSPNIKNLYLLTLFAIYLYLLFGFTSYLSNIWKKNDHLVISQVGRYSTVVNIRFFSRGLNDNFLNKLKYKKVINSALKNFNTNGGSKELRGVFITRPLQRWR